ncbi:lea domain protein [Phlyctema vagabunda]|uniref:Lea domain protein n=1 Tax=Phlyctema vagabunda TaxID=108571 RepID=A0ABR4P1E0_9HELO
MASTSLPSAQPIRLASNVTLQPPLSRRGRGPGLLIFLPSHYLPGTQTSQKSLDPEPLQKWAEEGYCVVEIRTGQLNSSTFEDTAAWAEVDIVEKSLEALKNSLQFDTNTVGVIVYQDADISKYSFNNIASIKAAVLFTAVGEAEWGVPVMVHCSGASPTTIADGVTAHFYNSVKTGNFVLPGHANFDVSAAGVAHTRSLGFLKNHLGGPNFDLEAIWDEHTLFEFGERDVQKTMGTMVQEPYVNHE